MVKMEVVGAVQILWDATQDIANRVGDKPDVVRARQCACAAMQAVRRGDVKVAEIIIAWGWKALEHA